MYGNSSCNHLYCNHSCPCCCTTTSSNIVFYVQERPKPNPLLPPETLLERRARLNREAVRENGKLLRTSPRESQPPPPPPKERNRCCSSSSRCMTRVG